MKKRILVSVVALSLIFWLEGCKGCGKAGQGLGKGSKVLAVVNGEKITNADLEEELAGKPDFYKERAQTEEGKRQIVDRLIEQKLLMQAAQKQQIADSPEIQAKIKAYEQRVLIDALRDKIVSAPAAPTEADIKQYYESHKYQFNQPELVRVRQIVTISRSKADQAYLEAKSSPTKFSDIAGKYSEDEASKSRGGDLGYVSKGTLPPELENKIFALKEGGISPVAGYQGKFYVFQVIEHRPAEQKNFEQAKEMIAKRLEYEKSQEKWKNYVEGLKKEAKIDYSK